MKTNFKKHILNVMLLLVLLMVISPVISEAASILTTSPTTYTPLAPLPDLTSSNLQLQTSVDFKSYVTYAFNLLIALGAVAAVFMITWGGFEYMTTDAVQGKSEGLAKIQNAIYGLLLILSSYLILRTIDPRFVNIPSTLVTPLNLHSTNTLNDWLSRLSSEVGAYNLDQSKARDQLQAAYAQQAQLQTQSDQLAAKVAQLAGVDVSQVDSACANNSFNPLGNTVAAGQTSTLDQACTDYYNSLNQQQNFQSSTTLFTVEKMIDGNVAACGTTGSLSSAITSTNNGNCYTNNDAAIAAVVAKYRSQISPGDLTTLQNYGNAAQTTLNMNSWFNSYDQTLTTYNYTYHGASQGVLAGVLTRVGSAIVNPGGASAAYANAQLQQTKALAGIESNLKNAKNTVTDATMYQNLVTQGNTLKAEISAAPPQAP